MVRVTQIKLLPGHSEAELGKKTAALLGIPEQEIKTLKIVRRSVDARKKPDIFYRYTVDVAVKNEDRLLRRFRGKENQVCRVQRAVYHFPEPGKREENMPVVIVGTGPAGLFCGYFLALHGYCPILLERGKRVEERRKDVEAFWESGRLNPESNVQFGEGGAGTFSDGKLNTLVKDRDGRNGIVLDTFVRFGAEKSILYVAKPHIGTDVLTGLVSGMREEIIRLGGQVRFGSRVTDICTEEGEIRGIMVNGQERISCSRLVMAIGHSARDTLSMLYERHVPMEAKAFAVGLRVEHSQALINKSQYGRQEAGKLGAASYKVAAKAKNGRGVYSFCMCPGGYVVNASSEEGRLAVNGMSYSDRGGQNANSAVIVTVTPEDYGSGHPLAGIAFQRMLEERAYALGDGKIPVQRYGDFRRRVRGDGEESEACPEDFGQTALLEPRCRGKYQWADVSLILPQECNEAIADGMEAFGRQIAGFDRPDVCLSGVESRTSSPVRILRDEKLQSAVRGLYPCGEGAGYAGGIVSAAMDGLRVAEEIAGELAPVRGGKQEKADM